VSRGGRQIRDCDGVETITPFDLDTDRDRRRT